MMLNYIFEADEKTRVPINYTYVTDNNEYKKISDTRWKNIVTHKDINPKHNEKLEDHAWKAIKRYNKNPSNQYKIGEFYRAKDGTLYQFNGRTFNPQSSSSKPLDDTNNQKAPEKQQTPKDVPSKTETTTSGVNSDLQGYAETIKNHPKRGKILTLLSRGDKVSLLAVDIILSSKEDEYIELLKSLNN